ncbi:unnamed protein product [Closterium sp. NIES-53]
MASHSLVSGLPCVFPSLPPSLAPPCTPCVVGRLRATPHSSSLRPPTAPFQTLHLDVWSPAPTLGPERERYFLVVVDDYSRYTTVFPLAKKSEVTSTLIRWLLATEGNRGSRVRCLHSDRGGEFCSGVLAGFYDEQGIRRSWTLSESPQQNGVAERRIGLVMDITRTSMIHACAPHFLWPYALRYTTHQLNLRCMSRGLKQALGSCHSLCLPWFPGWLSRILLLPPAPPPVSRFSHDVRFDESVSYYTRYPCRGLPVPPPPLFLAPSPPPAPAPSVPPPPLVLPRQVTVYSVGVGAGGATTGGTRSGGACSRGAGARGAGAGGASSGGAGSGGAGTGGASSGGAGSGGTGTGGASSGVARAGGAGTEEKGDGGAGTASPTACPHCHNIRFQSFHRIKREEQERVEQERQELQHHLQRTTGRCPPRARPSSPLADLHTVLFRSPPRRSPSVSVLPSPPESSPTVSSHPITDYYRAARPVVSRVLASLVTDPRASPSCVLALTIAVADFASTRRLDYATRVVAAPPPRPLSVGGESALGCDILWDRQFELEFLATAPPSLCAMLLSLEGDPDALDIRTPHTYREAVSGEWASLWKLAMDAELASWRSTGTYVGALPPPRANIVDGMWLFKVKRPPGSPPVFKAYYVAKGFSQHEGVDFFQTFAPTLKAVYTWRFGYAVLLASLTPSHLGPSGAEAASLQSPLVAPATLACKITRDRAARTITLTQSHMVQQVLWQFGFQFSTTQSSPLAVEHRLTGPFPDEPFESSGPYAKLVGCLMYLMTCTQPDLAFPLSVLSRFVATGRHRPVHWTASVRVAKYLATTSGMGLVLAGRQPCIGRDLRWCHGGIGASLRHGQARLDFVASEANTADVFTKALALGDHHRFCVQLGLVEVGPRLL